jgi:hypothetical protein
MISIRTAPVDLRQGLSRRDLLQLSLGAGLGFPSLPGSTAAAAPFPAKARSCILLYLFGGPSHLDIWDMKPEAPAEIRGEFKPIPTNVPGIRITEHLPKLARMADRYAIIRSLTHGDSSHGSASHTMLTGRAPRVLGEVPPTADDFPHYGAALDRLRPAPPGVLPFIALPWTISTSTNVVPGQDGGFLGRARDPFRLEPAAELRQGFEVPLVTLPADVPPERLAARRRLLDRLAGTMAADPAAREVGRIQERAFDALLSPRFWRAFQLAEEPAPLRERYGMNVFGQSVLLARRLVEAGAPLITVYWPERKEPEAYINNGVRDGVAVPAWDTHGYRVGNTPNFPRLRDHNLPPLDLALSTLLADLAQRGLLDRTLVVVTGEFGRSPRINPDGGRDHYGNVFSAMLAGGGIRGGQVYGSSDAIGAFPNENAVTAGDFAATLYACLGVAPGAELRDRLDRPHPAALGEPVAALLG